MLRPFLLLLAVWLGIPAWRGASFDYHVIGDPVSAPRVQTEGAVMLAGGGGEVDEAFRWFLRKAGGGRIVVLRASGGDGLNGYLFRELGGVASVETIVFHDREASTDPKVLSTIAHADGVFLAGGDQSLYVRYWKGTPVSAALDAHVRAGKPIGGTSAGLAILGQYCFSAMEEGELDSATALADPFNRQMTFETDFLHIPLLRGIITDTHFMARKRLGRLIAFVARLGASETPARVVGIGVDERTMLCVEADGVARVVSSVSEGRAWFVIPAAKLEVPERGRPLIVSEVMVVPFASGTDLPLAQLLSPETPIPPRHRVSVAAGKLQGGPE